VKFLEEESVCSPKRISAFLTVQVQVQWGEIELARRKKKNGGIWNKVKQVWESSYGKAREMPVEGRIVRK
jgi:hypothetical protein